LKSLSEDKNGEGSILEKASFAADMSGHGKMAGILEKANDV
jgi:hypothetical protein